jgi:hypothetical protein
MASVRKSTKQKALESATQAAVGSLGFFVSGNPILKDIAYHTTKAELTTERLIGIVQKLFEIGPPEDEEPSVREEFDKQVETIKKRGIDLAKLGLIIPLLMNQEAKEYLSSFIKGLTGIENLDNIKMGINAVLAVLAGVFAVKVFKQVSDSIAAVKKLGQVTAILFGITEAASDDISDQMDEVDKHKAEKEKEKKEVEKSKQKGKAARDDIRKEKKAVKGKNIFKKALAFLGKVAPKVGPKLLGAIPVIGTVAIIGSVLYDIASEAMNFFGDDDAEEEPEEVVEAENKPEVSGMAASSVPEPAGVEELSTPESPGASAQASTSEPVAKAPLETAKISASAPSPAPMVETVEQESLAELDGAANEPVLESPVIINEQGEIELSDDFISESLSKASEEVISMKKTKEQTVLINNVDLSTVISKSQEAAKAVSANYGFSTTVGK